MKQAVCVRDLGHRFGEKTVFWNISFDVEPGEIFGLLGPSGVGKTTLVSILTGQLKQTCGEVLVMGRTPSGMTGAHYRQIGIMMDHFGLYDRMSCYDNLKFYQMLNGENEKNIKDVLERVGLLEAKKTQVMNLSKGMKNRLAFARAVLQRPAILFLDEPTGGLDPATIEVIHQMILEEKGRGTTVFLTTHNMREAEKLCQRVVLLNDKKAVEYGEPAEICRRYYHRKKIKIHLKDGRDIVLGHEKESGERICDYLRRGELETIHSTEPDLETVFLELTGGCL